MMIRLDRAPLRTDGGEADARDTFHVTYDPATESPVVAISRAAALVRDVDETDLSPLVEVIDPDALARLVTGETAVSEVTFRYEGLSVTVSGQGDVWLERV